MTADEHAADLLSRGYLEVQEHGTLTVGDRVHHSGQRYWQAWEQGTATIERIFHKPDSAWARQYRTDDVEIIVTRDDGTPGFWANYHTIKVGS